MQPVATQTRSQNASLGLWDTISMIVGMVVGASIFKVPSAVFGNVTDFWQGLGLWLMGGFLSLAGALCYAELAATYPHCGGDYVFLSRAYGRGLGFLFGWARLIGIFSGSVGALAFVFSDYAVECWQLDAQSSAPLAIAPVAVLTTLNVLGVVCGKATQNLLTALKVLGLAGIVVAGVVARAQNAVPHITLASPAAANVGFAMIMILYAYGGWNDSAFIAAEIHHPTKNIPRSLIFGVGIVTAVYILVNAGYLLGLGFDGVRQSPTPAADLVGSLLGKWGRQGMSLLVMVSALGALNGLMFTGSRVHASLGADHKLFAVLGRWNFRSGSPVWALVTEAAVAICFIAGIGTATGRSLLHSATAWSDVALFPADPSGKYSGGFDTMVAATAPVFWSFFLLTGLALFVLRWRDRERPRGFAVPFYPVVPLVFCVTAAYMLYASVNYAAASAAARARLVVMGLLAGIPLYFVSDRLHRRS